MLQWLLKSQKIWSHYTQNIPLLASLDYNNFMLLGPDNDVVDGDVDELDKEPDEPHEAKPYGCGDGDLRKFFPVRLGISIALFMNM